MWRLLFFLIIGGVALENCSTVTECENHLIPVTQPFFAIDADHQAAVLQAVHRINQCPQTESLFAFDDPCAQRELAQINNINAAGMENMLDTKRALDQVPCSSTLCSQVRRNFQAQVDEFAFQYAAYCGNHTCEAFMHRLEKQALIQLAKCDMTTESSNCRMTYLVEVSRFNRDYQLRYFRRLIHHYATCPEGSKSGCSVDARLVAQLEFTRNHEAHGVNFTDLTRTGEQVREIAANWTRAMQAIRNTTENSDVVLKRYVFHYALVSLRAHLVKIQAVCAGNPGCLRVVRAEMDQVDRMLPLTSRWIPAGASITGLILSALLFLAGTAIVIFALAVAQSREWTYLALTVGITVTAGVRVCFWTIGWRGFGAQTFFSELAFYVVDKMASVAFALTLLLFLHMWIRAVHAEIYPVKSTHLRRLSVGFVLISAGLVGTSIALSVSYGRSHQVLELENYQTLNVVDLILATWLLVVGAALLAYVCITFVFLMRGASRPSHQERWSMYMVLAFTSALMLMFTVRAVLVFLGAGLFHDTFFVGYAIYYGVGTLAVEVVGSALIFLVTLMRFHAAASVAHESSRLSEGMEQPLLEMPEMYANI
uniref:Uncharacterized protein n=1 Tax=viral metagenome TaxID=1070528 RepID=A0A6C0BQA4_9ZZZZ